MRLLVCFGFIRSKVCADALCSRKLSLVVDFLNDSAKRGCWCIWIFGQIYHALTFFPLYKVVIASVNLLVEMALFYCLILVISTCCVCFCGRNMQEEGNFFPPIYVACMSLYICFRDVRCDISLSVSFPNCFFLLLNLLWKTSNDQSFLRDTFLGYSTCLHDVWPILPYASLQFVLGWFKVLYGLSLWKKGCFRKRVKVYRVRICSV